VRLGHGPCALGMLSCAGGMSFTPMPLSHVRQACWERIETAFAPFLVEKTEVYQPKPRWKLAYEYQTSHSE